MGISDQYERYIFFGAGHIGREFLKYVGKEYVLSFVDNDPSKWGTNIDGIPIVPPDGIKNELTDIIVVITVLDTNTRNDIAKGLNCKKIKYLFFEELKYVITRERIKGRTDYIGSYRKSIEWIKNNTIEDKGVKNNSDNCLPYPEVSGYYIPSLLRWGYRDLAIQYAKWLCFIQKDDGSWYNTEDTKPYVFDSGQILKGLISIRNILPIVDEHIKCGCDWIISNIDKSGRLRSPRENDFGNGSVYDEIIHLYCLSPLMEAGYILKRDEYIEKAKKALKYYLNNCGEKIEKFSLLSHFYAYVMEALVDLNCIDVVRDAMDRIKKNYMKENGEIPAYNDCNWVCSTGMFQLALVWFRLGDVETGNKVFKYAVKLQNDSGGWFGSYPSEYAKDEENSYFPYSEISWANKYFLDALYYKNKIEFDNQSSGFKDEYSIEDGRYIVIESSLKKYVNENKKGDGLNVLDAGCGKGAYIKNLSQRVAGIGLYAMDISEKVLKFVPGSVVEKRIGTLTMIPFEDDFFDVVYTCEALEHAIDIWSSLRELARVTKKGGRIIIIDKNIELYGHYEIGEWEQWFDKQCLKDMLSCFCDKVSVVEDLKNEDPTPDLFCAWIGTVK
ncbi:MAG: methyltransferase domain-containing protein [Lachnospiraceae bacterium]|nr:methyltransferase domain-containing protein [Lachnospiraceae bacterium]